MCLKRLAIGAGVLLQLWLNPACREQGRGGRESTTAEDARGESAPSPTAETARRPDIASGAKAMEQLRDFHERADAEGNAAPRARFEVLPPGGWAGLTTFTFDASLSRDDHDRSARLAKRWDFDGDGTWDVPFTRLTRVHHTFPDSGRFRPRLLLRDRGGLLDSIAGEPIRIRPACPPPDFALVDANPNSRSLGDTLRLSNQRGHRVLVWYAWPSK